MKMILKFLETNNDIRDLKVRARVINLLIITKQIKKED